MLASKKSDKNCMPQFPDKYCFDICVKGLGKDVGIYRNLNFSRF
jgi:hypothetical protein